MTDPLPGPLTGPPSNLPAFSASRFHFATSVPAGETVPITDDAGDVLLTYRSFVSVVPLIALLVAVIVFFTGVSAVAFLFAEGRPVPALIALVLSGAFLVLIAMLVPAMNVTLLQGNAPALTLMQQSNVSFPWATFVVATPDRRALARFRHSIWSRLGRNRWNILTPTDERAIGYAVEESFWRALVRKFLGKFTRRHQTDIAIHYLDRQVGRIVRRPDSGGEVDVLEITGDIDRRVAVALAMLILGSEP